MRKLIEMLADLKVPRTTIGGAFADACPLCKTGPFSGGTCAKCGYTTPPQTHMPLFSSDNAPLIIVCALIFFGLLGAVIGYLI